MVKQVFLDMNPEVMKQYKFIPDKKLKTEQSMKWSQYRPTVYKREKDNSKGVLKPCN